VYCFKYFKGSFLSKSIAPFTSTLLCDISDKQTHYLFKKNNILWLYKHLSGRTTATVSVLLNHLEFVPTNLVYT